MPPPDRMLNLLRRAIDHVQQTPGRSGHVVRLTDCTEVIVAGDLHGHVANFQAILKLADLANHPGRHLVLQEVIHSAFRYPNGGDKSHQMVDLFAALKCQFPQRVHMIPGNHELAQWTGRSVGKADESQNEVFSQGVKTAYGAAAVEIYRSYCDLFRALPLALVATNHVYLSHSLPSAKYMGTFDPRQLEQETFEDKDLVPGGVVYGLVWGRDTSERNVTDFLRKVDCDLLVTGHIPTEQGYDVPNDRQLIVDCSSTPAACVRFPTDRPITHAELVAGVVVL